MITDVADVATAVQSLFKDQDVSVERRNTVSGGCINRTSVLVLSNGSKLFLKENSGRYPGMFDAEARGLEALRSAAGPRAPAPYACYEDRSAQFLLLEYITPGSRSGRFWESFGRAMARLHKTNTAAQYGFEEDNYIGSTPQENSWTSSWTEFFAEQRLRYQIRLARDKGLADDRMTKGVESIISRLESLLRTPEHPSLLHGDFWGGNFMVGSDGEAVIIDPAVYYGDREADLAMSELFGGFQPRFYSAYDEEFPLERDYKERKELYNLYHMLNHLNLFGRGYAGSVNSIVRRFT
jgi:fructosamine-3-kinase